MIKKFLKYVPYKVIKSLLHWFSQHLLTIVCCALIVGLGITFLVWSSPGTTTIGENISTGNITASGNLEVSGNATTSGKAKTGRTATIVVAAYNSSTSSKAQADYICDGVDDQVEIQAAIDSLPASGGKVVLSEGTFLFSGAVSGDGKNNVTISGSGSGDYGATRIKLANGANSNLFDVKGNFWRFSNIYFDGNKSNQTLTSYGIYFYSDFTYLFVDNCVFKDFYTAGIRFEGHRGEVTKSLIGYNKYGVELAGHLDIFESYIVSNEEDGVHGIEGCPDWRFIGNVVKGNGGNGVDVAARWGIIQGNIFLENGGSGVKIESGSTHIKVVGNDIRLNGIHGIYLIAGSHAIISNNAIQQNTQYGIRFSGDYHTITGNVINENDYGGTGTYSGIILVGTEYTGNRIINNIVRLNGKYGIELDTGVLYRQYIINNDLTDNTVGALPSGLPSNVVISGNVGYTTENSGIAILPAGSNSTTIDHGLAGTPSVITVTATSTDIGNIAVTSKGSTSFTITTSATSSSDVGIYWEAKM